MSEARLALLRQELERLARAREVLEYSYAKCREIGLKERYTLDELDRFEALTSRFARLCDLLTQKILTMTEARDARGAMGLAQNAPSFSRARSGLV